MFSAFACLNGCGVAYGFLATNWMAFWPHGYQVDCPFLPRPDFLIPMYHPKCEYFLLKFKWKTLVRNGRVFKYLSVKITFFNSVLSEIANGSFQLSSKWVEVGRSNFRWSKLFLETLNWRSQLWPKVRKSSFRLYQLFSTF